jgi:hypothetical protein
MAPAASASRHLVPEPESVLDPPNHPAHDVPTPARNPYVRAFKGATVAHNNCATRFNGFFF